MKLRKRRKRNEKRLIIIEKYDHFRRIILSNNKEKVKMNKKTHGINICRKIL